MEYSIDKNKVNIVSMTEEPSDLGYWLSVSWEKRLSALESLRQHFYNYNDKTTPRLQRVYKIIKQA